MIPINLLGKTALITGATGELGCTMVRTLAQAGADVIVHYHSNVEQAERLTAEMTQTGRRALAVQADITDETSMKALRDRAAEAGYIPDIVVANAVIQYEWTTVLKQPLGDYDSQYRSCVKQAVLLAQNFVPHMIETGWGRVIGINTECSMQSSETQSAYAAGKRGMDGVIRVLAKEVGEHGITVNQVAPGWTKSKNSPESDGTLAYSSKVPLRRRGSDQEIANVVAFLASDLAAFITGAYIPVCGGNVMPAI